MPNTPSELVASKALAPTSSHGRLIEVLDALVRRADGEAWGVRELAGELMESRSTVNRILAALVDRDFAVEDGAGKYRIGPRFRVLMHALAHRSALLNSARQLLHSLAEDTKQTVLLSAYAAHLDGYYVLHCGEASAKLSFRPKVGNPFPLSFGDIGRAFREHLRQHPIEGGVSPRQHQIESPLGITEAEFPPAVALVVKQLVPGMLVILSLHDLGGFDTRLRESYQVTLDEVANRLSQTMEATQSPGLEVVSDGDSSIVARLEGLLQMVCAEPNGYKCRLGLAAQLQCNTATAKKIVGSATSENLVDVDGQMIFPAARLYQWAALLSNQAYSQVKLCKAIVDSLVKETGETIAYLSFNRNTLEAQFLDVIQGWRPIQYKLETGVDVPLYAGGAGKAVLAHLPLDYADGLKLEKLTDSTITSHTRLKADLESIRERGWSVGDGERVLGAFGIGVPFFIDGKVAGSISATIPQHRKEDCDVPSLVESMKLASRRISRLLSLGETGSVE